MNPTPVDQFINELYGGVFAEKLIAAHHEAHRKQGGGYRKAGNCR